MLVKRMVIQKARTSVVMCTQEKLRCLMPYTFATMKDVDYLISDAPMPEPFQKAAKEHGTILL